MDSKILHSTGTTCSVHDLTGSILVLRKNFANDLSITGAAMLLPRSEERRKNRAEFVRVVLNEKAAERNMIDILT